MKPHILNEGPSEIKNHNPLSRIVDFLFPKVGQTGKDRVGTIELKNDEIVPEIIIKGRDVRDIEIKKNDR